MKSGRSQKDIYAQNTQVELCFENLMAFIYGKRGAVISAGDTSLPYLKKSLLKLFRTLGHAAKCNIHGDEAHKLEIIKMCDSAVEQVGRARSKDAVTQWSLNYTFHLIFLLLGRFPNNWRKAKAGWQSTTELSDYRTLVYVRTPKQKVTEMRTYAYLHSPSDEEDTQFTRIINAQRRHPHDDQRVLEWIRTNEPELFARFNKA